MMKKRKILFLMILPVIVNAKELELQGRVVAVHDGDTITILNNSYQQTKVRLAQIDAPEMKQDFGKASKQHLSDLVFGQYVTVDSTEFDRYGRVVGKIKLNGLDINLEQIKSGMAWVYRQYDKDPTYYAAEEIAHNKRLGLWAQPNPQEPWTFRHSGEAVFVSKPVIATSKMNKRSMPKLVSSDTATIGWTCGTKHFCKEMQSCAEAQYYLKICDISKLDGNKDGLPCESLCH
jgi:endonuclease YncB( thermonuclease family)